MIYDMQHCDRKATYHRMKSTKNSLYATTKHYTLQRLHGKLKLESQKMNNWILLIDMLAVCRQT